MRPVIDFTIDDEQWEETGSETDLSSRLLTSVQINGVNHHLEAFAVIYNWEAELLEAEDPTFEDRVNNICLVAEPDGPWKTVKIKGREYILVMTPFC